MATQNWVNIGSDNRLMPDGTQAITWTNVGLSSVELRGVLPRVIPYKSLASQTCEVSLKITLLKINSTSSRGQCVNVLTRYQSSPCFSLQGDLVFPLIYAWINVWSGGLRRHRAHYDVTVMWRESAGFPSQRTSSAEIVSILRVIIKSAFLRASLPR